MILKINDTNIDYISKLTCPSELRNKYKLNSNLEKFISQSRETIQNILIGKDKRLLCIVGPCSIHKFSEAYDYAVHLHDISKQYKNKLFIVMRTYFEKPRTTIGWKGFINDPDLDNSFKINKGLDLSRKLLYKINTLGLPCGTEILDSITAQYLSDLLSWGSIGSRTVESQIHRQIASGCSFPIGFKNNCNGCIDSAINAIICSHNSHCFMGISLEGEPSICKTLGNQYGHIILRGSYNTGPNYSRKHIENTIYKLGDINTKIVVDCSHGNSNKDYRNQKKVITDIGQQLINYGDLSNIKGIMLESNINCGKQKLLEPNTLEYGISITDSCIDLYETDILLGALDKII